MWIEIVGTKKKYKKIWDKHTGLVVIYFIVN